MFSSSSTTRILCSIILPLCKRVLEHKAYQKRDEGALKSYLVEMARLFGLMSWLGCGKLGRFCVQEDGHCPIKWTLMNIYHLPETP
jgi:hypothetical protein